MIVVCGEALIDFIAADHDGSPVYIPRPGGSPLNVAIGLGRLGADAAYLGKISTDPFGETLMDHMKSSGVSTELVSRGDELTTLAFVHRQPKGEPGYSFYNRGTADRNLLSSDLPDRLPNNTDLVHFGSISLLNEPSASTLESLMIRERSNRLISYDPNVRPSVMSDRSAYVERVEHLVGLSSLVKVSSADLLWLYPRQKAEDVCDRWLDTGPELVVVTDGKNGAQGFTSSARVGAGGRSIEVVDSVGAGDAFMAGMLCRMSEIGLLDGNALRECDKSTLTEVLAFANNYASLSCGREGANPPHRFELDVSND